MINCLKNIFSSWFSPTSIKCLATLEVESFDKIAATVMVQLYLSRHLGFQDDPQIISDGDVSVLNPQLSVDWLAKCTKADEKY